YHEVRTKRAIIENSRHVMLVVDHSKFGRNAMVNMGSISMVDADEGLSQPGIVVKTSSPQGEHERLPNPTLAVTDGRVTVKFHP
ncbi:VOC family protein, partial [Salmonella enterica subsp. enterica serovar Kentucky]|nr:VOC family protein [Salmonella enterica subsp. enterica serovar Kentucky]